ncbi:arginine kinase 1 isoform X2 [Anastrepha ludens]|nr:arginine kinase 1 isoform X2 [Anastrepha ludens]
MFALWYLSFAIDEIRKHFGWFFGNLNIKLGKNAIENKEQPLQQPQQQPAAINKITDNKPVPEPKPVKPEIKPVTSTPVAPTPAKPIEKPAPATPPSTPISSPSVKPTSSIATLKKELATDALDKKLQEAGKPFQNGNENLKDNLKDATTGFLQKESQKQTERKLNIMVDAAVIAKLEEGYAKLAASDSKSLLKKYLTKEVFDNLKNKKTPTFGSSLLDVIQSGLANHDSGVGIYAPDAEAYTVFADLFDPIIEDYHGGFKKTDKHPPKDFGDVSTFGNLDPNNEFVISTRVRCGRSLEGYPFNPCLTEAQYKEMEAKVSSTLSGLEGELKGKFYPLTGMEKSVQQQLIDDHFLFKEGDRFLQAANACRYWPSGRGIYHNDNKTFLVWCNEEDHLRIISMQMGGDLGEVFRRLTNAVNEIEKRIPFSHDDRLGFLTFCPTNLGTTIRASVHIKLPKLAANLAKLEEVAGKYNLQVRGTRGEHTEAEGGIYDISNKRRMGLTEYQAVKEMYDGITELIKIEKSM